MNEYNLFIRFFMNLVQHYNHQKYWRMRELVNLNTVPKFIRYYYLFRIKQMDAYNNASLGTNIDKSSVFKSHPNLPHGIRGIFISHEAIIGENVTIFQQVTIGEGKNGAPIIGDNCYIGAGAKIVGKIKVGNNVRIGAGCIVAFDVPDNCTVVMDKPRIIMREINNGQ